MLRHLPPLHDPNLLVGRDPADDAAVYRLSDDLALVQTVDFFTPIVDDPYTFGQIAAANSLSDVYAMGGTPLTALNVVAFPSDMASDGTLGEVLRGGADMAARAGVSIVGGHTIDDVEPKYGLAVTGTVHPNRYVSAHGAQPGDHLVLTKPLGTGVIATALKNDAAGTPEVSQAVRWMVTLNRSACETMLQAQAHAATDITGFGLLGHLLELCEASDVSAEIFATQLPLLWGALGAARAGYNPAGSKTNWESVQSDVSIDQPIGAGMEYILADPQTSGGLLVCLDDSGLKSFRERAPRDVLASEIGRITQTGAIRISVRA